MKQIEFKKIRIKNFLSVGSSPVEVGFTKGLHIITGINKDKEDRRNGVGKSTIADAIYYAVFGETLRDLKKDHIVNNVNKKGCEVELDVVIKQFNKAENIKIIRTLEPSKCFLYVDGEDKTLDSITNTSNFIHKKFSCTPEIFQNCVIMTINNTIPFMAKKKQEKRKFIEDIFNLSIFSNMLNILKVDINEKKKSFDIESTRYDDAVKVLSNYEKQKENAIQEKKNKHDKYIQRRHENDKELSDLKSKIKSFVKADTTLIENDIKTLQDGLSKIDKKIQAIRDTKTKKSLLIQQYNKQYSTIGTEKDTCPVCLRAVEDHDKTHILSTKKEIKNNVEQLTNEVSNSIKNEKDLQSKQSQINDKIALLRRQIHNSELEEQRIQNCQQRIDQLKQWQTMLEQDIKDLDSTTQAADDAVEDQKTKIQSIKDAIENIKNELNMLDVVKFVVSEEGVKSYVVKKILKIFNNRLAYYLKKMDANCHVVFNEYFEEEIVDNKGKPCSYFNFSGAERKNIDLACLFTFMDIRRLQGDVSFNFSIYDELFDSSLDERGVELVINLLKERVDKFKDCIMVISHRKESIKAATGEIIFLEKLNGITRRVDFKELAT